MSKAWPCIQPAKAGEAIRLFSDMASLARSLTGKNESISITPTFLIGGVWMNRIKFSIDRSWPLDQASLRIFDRRMCSRLVSGSALMLKSESKPDTALEI